MKKLLILVITITMASAYNSNLGGYETDTVYDTTPDYDYYQND